MIIIIMMIMMMIIMLIIVRSLKVTILMLTKQFLSQDTSSSFRIFRIIFCRVK